MSTKNKLQTSDRCSPSENNTSIVSYITYLRLYRAVLTNFLENGREEFVTSTMFKKRKGLYLNQMYSNISVMPETTKAKIKNEIRTLDQIINSYEKFRTNESESSN